jgi:hypothetical protein
VGCKTQISRDYILADIEASLVTHYRVKNWCGRLSTRMAKLSVNLGAVVKTYPRRKNRLASQPVS